MPRRRRRRLRGFLLVLLFLIVGLPLAVRFVLFPRWESNPVLRGAEVAEHVGCAACHLPPDRREIPNPGSRWGTVPRFGAGNATMYVDGVDELEEFVRLGAPRDWLEDGKIRERLRTQRIRMPAYGERLDDDEIAAVLLWTRVLEGVDVPGGEEVEAGRELAREHGCLACHGLEGAGGRRNPGSVAGFVPGFLGENFLHLVRDREEFDEWVLEGRSERLASVPLVGWFWERQTLEMPAYSGALDDEDLDRLWAWVRATREWLGAEPVVE